MVDSSVYCAPSPPAEISMYTVVGRGLPGSAPSRTAVYLNGRHVIPVAMLFLPLSLLVIGLDSWAI
jgi:hypothetical protein